MKWFFLLYLWINVGIQSCDKNNFTFDPVQERETNWNFTGCQVLHFMMVCVVLGLFSIRWNHIVYQVEPYCRMFLPFKYRSALSKFRCRVAPLRLETGRFEGLDVNQRICPICHKSVKDEKHVLLYCPFYLEFRTILTNKACKVNANFRNLKMSS